MIVSINYRLGALGFLHLADPPHDESRRATMLLGRECEVAAAPLESEREAWQGIL